MDCHRILLVWVASLIVMTGSSRGSAAAQGVPGESGRARDHAGTVQDAGTVKDEGTRQDEGTGPDEIDRVPCEVVLGEPALDESSGLAVSGIRAERFWSHNDSGGLPRIFAFDSRTGRKTAEWRLSGAKAVDWEDMASYREGEIARILVADCGDNNAKRPSIRLYLFDEPDPDGSGEIDRYRPIDVVYPDGPRDCEAVAVDPTRGEIFLVEKAWGPLAGIYTLPLPARDPASEARPGDDASRIRLRATRVGTVTIPLVTAMDLEPESGEIWVTNYFQAFRFRCEQRDEPVARQLSRVARGYDLPRWRQIEAVAVEGPDRVWVTTEGSPARLGRVRVAAD